MIILPERDTPRGRLLMPMRPLDWREPSARLTTWGIRNVTRWRLTARANDGFIVWRGWFDDREDADAFLFAAACGSLHYERELWDLPVPAWRPDMYPELAYDFATVTFLTSPITVNTNYTIPVDWNSANNSLECVGGGSSGSGSGSSPSQNAGAGGGAGAYAKGINYSATAGALVNYQIGRGGPGIKNGSGYVVPNAGGNTWFGNAAFGSSTAGAQGGSGPATQTANMVAPGGLASASFGNSTKNNGGNGRSGTAAYVGAGGGGGGAGGPNGAGAEGGLAQTAIDIRSGGGGGADGGTAGGQATATTGGVGGNNRFGTGGGAAGTASAHGQPGSNGGGGGGAGAFAPQTGGKGGDGTEWDGTHGCGGGGGGAGASTYDSGNGGLYGGGGGGGNFNNPTLFTGDGGQGLLVITYTPGGLGGVGGLNMAMMGM